MPGNSTPESASRERQEDSGLETFAVTLFSIGPMAIAAWASYQEPGLTSWSAAHIISTVSLEVGALALVFFVVRQRSEALSAMGFVPAGKSLLWAVPLAMVAIALYWAGVFALLTRVSFHWGGAVGFSWVGARRCMRACRHYSRRPSHAAT
jgi:hypothetical protein